MSGTLAFSCQPPPYSPQAAAHGTAQYQQYVPPPQPLPVPTPPAVYQYHPPAPASSLNSVWPIAFHAQNGVHQHAVEGTLGTPQPASPFAMSAQEDAPSAYNVDRCQRIGVRELGELVDCTDLRLYDVDATMAKFGTEKCSFEVEYVCR